MSADELRFVNNFIKPAQSLKNGQSPFLLISNGDFETAVAGHANAMSDCGVRYCEGMENLSSEVSRERPHYQDPVITVVPRKSNFLAFGTDPFISIS